MKTISTAEHERIRQILKADRTLTGEQRDRVMRLVDEWLAQDAVSR